MVTKRQGKFYSGRDYQIDESIAFLMRNIIGVMTAVVEERMAEHGLTDAQWKPLLMISQRKCKTAAELARMACVDTGAVTRLLDRIEAKGLVKRIRSSEDRRVVNLELTEEGVRSAAGVPYVMADVLNGALEGFSEEEVRQLKDMLRRMLDNTRRMQQASDTPNKV